MANSHGGSKCNSDSSKANNAYETKFQDMQKYIPFLEKMIQRLQHSKGSTRENQLAKMKSLYTILSDGKNRLTLESLEKCDSILRNLYQKVEGEEGDIMQQSLSPKNKDGKPVQPTTTATKAKENEPNPTWVFGSPKKPPPGFKKNFKKQKLANVKAPGHARPHQRPTSQSKQSAANSHDEPSKHKVTKLSSKISDLKSGKIKTNVMKHASKVSSPPPVITSPPNEDSSVSDHNKSTVNQSKKSFSINADQKKSIGNSSLTQHSAIGSNQDKPIASSPLTQHSSMNCDKKKEAVSSYTTHHSTKSSKQTGNTTVAQHSSSNLEKKNVSSSSLKQLSTSNSNVNKKIIRSPVTPTSMLNAEGDKAIPSSSITQNSAPKSNVDKQMVESQVKLNDAKNSGQDVGKVSSTTIQHPHISSDNSPLISNSASGVCDQLQSSSSTLLSNKKVEPNRSFNVSHQKTLPSSSFTFKTSDIITKPSTTSIDASHSPPINPDGSFNVSHLKTLPSSSTTFKTSDIITKPSTTSIDASHSPPINPDGSFNVSHLKTLPSSSTTFKTSDIIPKPSTTSIDASHSPPINPDGSFNVSHLKTLPSSSTTFKTSDNIRKPSTTSIDASHSPPTNPDELSIKRSTTVLSENKSEKRDDVTNLPVIRCDQLPQKRLVSLPSPKDPRLARGLLTKGVFSERWKQPTYPLQECKTELRQENASCKTETRQENVIGKTETKPENVIGKTETKQENVIGKTESKPENVIGKTDTRQENVTGKTELSQSKSLRAKLAEQITTVHKVGISVGGALRTLTKNMSSIEQNRIANLKPGTIIDLMDKKSPKTNKKLKQDKFSNQIPDHQNVKTNQSITTTHKSALSSLSKEELEKLVVKNIHNLPALPPGTMQMLERISTNTSQGSPINYPGSVCNPAISDQATNRFDSSQASRTSDLHNKSEGSLSNSAMSEEVSNRFDPCQNPRTSEFCNRIEGNLSNSVNIDQTSNRVDSSQSSRPTELYERVGRSSSISISDQASNRFNSCQNSRTSEFYNIVEGSNSVIDDQTSNRFDPYQNSSLNEFHNRVESPAGNYSNWESHALDSVGMSSPFRIQSPNYTQTNSSHDTSGGNNIYNRSTGLSSLYNPSIGSQSQNFDSPMYATNYYRDPRRRSLEQADSRSPEAEDWQRVVIREDRPQFTPDYLPSSDSVWSEDNSRLPSRYHKGNMGQNSNQYGRTLITCRSNSTPSSVRRHTDHRFSPERTPGRLSNPRSSVDYPEERRYSDSRPASERRVSEARLKRYRDYNESDRSFNTSSADRYTSYCDRSGLSQDQCPDWSSLEHERTHPASRSSHDRSFNTSSADKYTSYCDRSGLSQERDSRYSDSRMASSRRDTDSYRSNNRRDTFTSPLDQLYSETRGPVTGRGYGVQNFRVPRFKPKESDHTSKRKTFDKNSPKSIESKDASKSTELTSQTTPKEVENEDDSKFTEKMPPSNDSSFEESSSKEKSHSREEKTLSIDSDIENEEITKKSLECNENVTDEIPITASNFVEERKVIILLDKSDMESSKEQDENVIFPDDSVESKKLEVDGSEVKSKLETPAPGDSRLLEGSDDLSKPNSNTETEEKQSVNKHSDSDSVIQHTNSVSTTPEICGNELSKLISKEDAACNVDSETTIPVSALTEPDNISISSPKKSESLTNETAEISHDEKEKEEESKNKEMEDGNEKYTSSTIKPNSDDQKNKEEEEEENTNKEMEDDNEKYTLSTTKPSSDDQKSKEKLPTMNSTCLDNTNSDQPLEPNTLEKNNDNSIEVDLSNESGIPIKKESPNDIQHCKIEEPCIKEDKEASSSGCGQSNRSVSDIEDQENKVLELVEVLMKTSLQAEEKQKLLAKIRSNPKKLRKIQQILELSSDEEEEDNVDSKNVGSEIQDDIKPVISVGMGLENEATETNKNEHKESFSNKDNDNAEELRSTTIQLIETNKKSKQRDANRKKISPTKRTRNRRSCSNKKLEIPENVETWQEIEKGKRKKSELDKLHDGIREMFLKAKIEKTSGIRSCRLRNANITAPNKVDKSPEANRKKLQKEKGSRKDEMDESGKNLEDKEDTKDSLEHENDKLEGTAQVEVKDSREDNEQATTKSNYSSNVENKVESDDKSKSPNVSKVGEAINSTINQNKHDKQKADDDLLKCLIMSSSTCRSTPIVLLQKSNALMSNKTFSTQNSSTSKSVAESVGNESEYQEHDRVIQQPCPTAVSTVMCENVDDSHALEKAVETNDPTALKKSKKCMKKKNLQEDLNKDHSVKDFQEDLDKDESVNIEKNPVILLEKRDSVEPVFQTTTETDVLPNNDNLSTDPASQSDTSKNDKPIEVSSSHADMGKVVCRKRPSLEYSELPNIFTDKTYFQKDTASNTLKHDCKICNFFGKSIQVVKHYVTEHSDQDVLISRLEANDAKEAIMKSENTEEAIKPQVFKCYMCCRVCTNLASFYDHITSHTGEYRYRCQICPFKVANKDAIKSHCTSLHSLDWKTSHKTAIVVDPIPYTRIVFGFMCSDCYFVQLKQSTVMEHVKNHHILASGVCVIRINMSSLEPLPARDTDKKHSNVPQNIPKNPINSEMPEFPRFSSDELEISERYAVDYNQLHKEALGDDDSRGIVQESREMVLNVSAFSCTEPMNDLSEKQSVMKETLQNIEETLFSMNQTVCGTISSKISKLSDSWKSSSGNERNFSQAEKISKDEADSNIQFPREKVPESHDFVNTSSAAEEEVTELMNIEEDQLNQVDKTSILEEIKLATFDLEDGDNKSIGFEECPDDFDKSSKINCLLNRWQKKHGDSEENENSGQDKDDDENEDLRGGENDFFSLVSKARGESAVVSKVNVGPLTISRSKERVIFSCNISCCHFKSDNPKYIVCHFGNHLTQSSRLTCSCCNEEFDGSLDTVGLMKGIVKHGLQHVLPPTPTPPPTSPPTVGDTREQSRRGIIRVRRLSGDQLSSFVEENSDNSVAGPSTSNDSVGNLRIESVVSAANCDFETLQALNSLHDKPSRKRRHEETEVNTVQPLNLKVLTDFYKCMGENCEFSTNDSALFKAHLKNFHCRKRSGSWFKCAYCVVHESCMTGLVKHINLYHSHSMVQCAHCFYRSVSKSNVIFHQNSVHVNKEIKLYLCKNVKPIASSYLPELNDVIPAFSCTFGLCRLKSYSWNAIQRHMVTHRTSDRPCHVCKTTFNFSELNKLFLHYLTHNIGLYQCSYCLHAQNTAEEMRGHLCIHHPDLKPQAYMRPFQVEDDLFCSSDIDAATNARCKQIQYILFDDIEEPEGSVIDFTGGINESLMQDEQENESSAFDEHMWAQAQMRFEPVPSPTNSLHIEIHQLPPTCEMPNLLPQSDNSQQVDDVRQFANSTQDTPPLEETGQHMYSPFTQIRVDDPPDSVSVFVPTLRQREAIRETIRHHPPSVAAQVQRAESEAENNGSVRRSDIADALFYCPDSMSSESDEDPTNCTVSSTVNSTPTQVQQAPTNETIDISSESEADDNVNFYCPSTPSESDEESTNDDPHMCFLCNLQFNNLLEVNEHLLNVHKVTKTKIVMKHDCTSGSMVKVVRSEITLELPEFVPPKLVEQSLRFSCSVCNYLTLQDQMLILHMKTFHEDTTYYECPHCTNVIVPIEKIAHHLRMHDIRMYRCAYCTYHHYQRHLISKHLNEKHPERKPYVQIVRDPDPVDDGFKSTEECDDEFNSHNKSLNVWQCLFCDTYRNMEVHIKDHCKATHGIQERYKCCFCPNASDSEESIRDHFKAEHLRNELQIVHVYDRVCIFSPMPEYNTSVDVGLPRRRERNLRDNIRGITFAEGLRPSTRRTDYGNQTWSHFKCPECSYITKSKSDFIQHMRLDYEYVVSGAVGSSSITEKSRSRIDEWIDLVIQKQEGRMLEHQAKSGDADGGDSKDQDQRSSEDQTPKPKPIHSRKRSMTKRFSTSDSSDDAGENKKTKRTRICKPRFKCGYCSFQCFLIKSMEKHQEERHPGRPGLIQPISERSPPQTPPPSSPIQPKAESIYECQICGRLDHKNALLDHFHNTHPSTDVKISLFVSDSFKCNHCGIVDASYERLTMHSHNEHPKMPVDVITVEKTAQEQLVKSPDYSPGSIGSNMRYSCSSCKAIFNAHHACRLHIKKEHDSNALIMTEYLSNSSQIPRSVATKKTAAAKNQIAKKSTSKVRKLDNTSDEKIYNSTVVLSDLRNTPKQ